MALRSTTNWWNRIGGSDSLCGAGFDPGATANMLADGAATSATGNSPVFTSASYSFVAGDVGHWVYIGLGTNWIPGYYQIDSVSAGAATLKAAIGEAYTRYWGQISTVAGCATTGSPTGATFSINYCDSDTAILNTVDLTSTASTTVTSATAGFTPVMVGNILALRGGFVATQAYYLIVTYVSASQLTLDRASGTYANGNYFIGGAFASLDAVASTGNGGLNTPAYATPLAAGHTVNIQGSGDNDPSGTDYDYSGSASAYQGYYTAPNGNDTDGRICLRGYNGRPNMLFSGLLYYEVDAWSIKHLKFTRRSTGGWDQYGIFGVASTKTYGNIARDIINDLNGHDGHGLYISSAIDCWIRNTGGGATGGSGAGIQHAENLSGYNFICAGNYVSDVRGDGYVVESGKGFPIFVHNIADSCGRHGFGLYFSNPLYYGLMMNNIAYGCAGDGLRLLYSATVQATAILNFIAASNGGYGIDCALGAAALLNDSLTPMCDYNAFYNNTSGERYQLSAGMNDVTLSGDPFTDSPNGDFSLNDTAGAGAECRATGFPGEFAAGLSIGYLDIGAVQHQDSAPSSGGFVPQVFE